MQRQTTGKPYLLKDKQCIQQIKQRVSVKKTHLYQLLIITLVPLPSHTPCTILHSLGVVAVFA